MRTIIATLAMVLAASAANAAPVYLSCTRKGLASTFRIPSVAPEHSEEYRDVYSITVDIENKKLTADDELLPIYIVSDDTIYAGFRPPGERLFLITLNRVTGKITINRVTTLASTNYVQTFDGTCKPAQRLF
jgi:hypothetical protein